MRYLIILVTFVLYKKLRPLKNVLFCLILILSNKLTLEGHINIFIRFAEENRNRNIPQVHLNRLITPPPLPRVELKTFGDTRDLIVQLLKKSVCLLVVPGSAIFCIHNAVSFN